MIRLEITADTPADLKAQLAALLGGTAPVAVTAEAAAPAAEKPKTTRKAAEPKAEVEQAPTEEQADTTDKLDFNTDVAPVVVATVEKFGKPVVVEVFAQFGVAKASEVPEAQWGELITALNDAAATAKPLA